MEWKMATVSAMTDAEYAAWEAAMEPAKRARIARMKQQSDRRRSVCADRLVRELAATVVGCAPGEIVLGATDRGAPFVVGRDVYISISQSGDRVLCAAATVPVGADIQQLRPVKPATVRRVCLPTERDYVGEDAARFAEVWTFKEAVFKCRGTGITRFDSVDYFSDTPSRTTFTDGDYVGCVVTEKKALPCRKPTRLKDYDYCQDGAYFVTICTQGKRALLCEIVGEGLCALPSVRLSPIGIEVETAIQFIEQQYLHISVDKYAIMPNHIHMLLTFSGMAGGHGNQTIHSLIRDLKSFTSKKFQSTLWQRSFHDHIVRNETDYQRIWKYIDENPVRWDQDCYYIG